MSKSNTYKAGKHFLQVPGPTNIPDRILRAIDAPAMDHRGPKFQDLSKRILEKIKLIFKSTDPVVIYPSAGTGAMEASLVNTLSEGDKILMFETGEFARQWYEAAERFKIKVDFCRFFPVLIVVIGTIGKPDWIARIKLPFLKGAS